MKTSLQKRAIAMWVRTGRPAVDVLTMTEDEVERLAAFDASDDFAADMKLFVSDYLEARKATDETTETTE